MIGMYEELNDEAKDFFCLYLEKELKNNSNLDRLFNEVDVLYNKGLLFIVQYLFYYKKDNKKVQYHFRGMANNLLLLYELKLTNVDPIKYNLPYELFTDKKFCIDFSNASYLDFLDYLEVFTNEFRVIKGTFIKDDIEEINTLEDNLFLIIPAYYTPSDLTFKLNEFNHLETVEDYRILKDKYITIRIVDKPLILDKKVNIQNSLNTKFEKDLEFLLKPVKMSDYVKIISMAHSTKVWKNNQEQLFYNGKVNMDNLIANREDIYEYLIDHFVTNKVALDIIRFIAHSRIKESNELWKKYIEVMKEHNCDDRFINILSKTLFIFGRGQAIDECLYALDENNYYTD